MAPTDSSPGRAHDPSLTPEEVDRRRRLVAQVRHSTQLEGGRSGEQARTLQDAYVRGEFGASDLVARTRQLHAPTSLPGGVSPLPDPWAVGDHDARWRGYLDPGGVENPPQLDELLRVATGYE